MNLEMEVGDVELGIAGLPEEANCVTSFHRAEVAVAVEMGVVDSSAPPGVGATRGDEVVPRELARCHSGRNPARSGSNDQCLTTCFA